MKIKLSYGLSFFSLFGILVGIFLIDYTVNNVYVDKSQISVSNRYKLVSNVNASPQPIDVGTNIGGVVDYSTDTQFVDLFKRARPWTSNKEGQSWGQGGFLDLDENGWVKSLQPTQYADTLLDTEGVYPGGDYTLLYEGEGSIDTPAFWRTGVTKINDAPGRNIYRVEDIHGVIGLRISSVNPSNPIRNIRFIMPGFENTYQTQPFPPDFLSKLSKFKNLRFMDWGSTNNSPIVQWSERSTPAYYTQGSERGVSLEYMIDLANTLNIDPWFCVPHKATDEYVREMAKLIKARLKPNLKAHIEYSNEVWNWIFQQTPYVRDKGLALGLSTDPTLAFLRYYSQRSVEIFDIFEEVYGAERSARVIRILASQSANPWLGKQVMTWNNAYQKADNYAIAPYFSGSGLNDVANINDTLLMTEDQILDNLISDIRTNKKIEIENNFLETQRWGLSLIAYEGGQHLTTSQFPVDKEAAATDLFKRVNRHPRMKDAYLEYLNIWKSAGGKLFDNFSFISTPSKYGFWGILESQRQDVIIAPKWQAVKQFIESQQPLPVIDTTKPSVPGALNIQNKTINSVTIQWSASTDNIDVIGYEIYRNGTKINQINNTSYLDSGLNQDTEYRYIVKAKDAAGNLSSASNEVLVLTEKIPPSSVVVEKKYNYSEKTLIRGENTGVYMLEQGEKRPFIAPEIFLSYKYGWEQIVVVKDNIINDIKEGAPMKMRDGSLIARHGGVYVIGDGFKRPIASARVFIEQGYNWNNVVYISEAAFQVQPTGPLVKSYEVVNGSLIYTEGSGAFLVELGRKRPFTEPYVVDNQYSWKYLIKVNKDVFDSIPPGEEMKIRSGSVIAGNGGVYIFDGSVKKPVPSAQIYLSRGYRWDAVAFPPLPLFNSIPTGSPIE